MRAQRRRGDPPLIYQKSHTAVCVLTTAVNLLGNGKNKRGATSRLMTPPDSRNSGTELVQTISPMAVESKKEQDTKILSYESGEGNI